MLQVMLCCWLLTIYPRLCLIGVFTLSGLTHTDTLDLGSPPFAMKRENKMHREKVLKNIFLALGQEAQLCLPRFQQRRTDTRHVEWVCRLWAACQGKLLEANEEEKECSFCPSLQSASLPAWMSLLLRVVMVL
ncbi:hypothetical protein NQZ68_003769 [Dissostichus eleginoides]|nr:hypothetical protein NQZ68_003769 [Dissostichus eleginoides]